MTPAELQLMTGQTISLKNKIFQDNHLFFLTTDRGPRPTPDHDHGMSGTPLVAQTMAIIAIILIESDVSVDAYRQRGL